MSNGSVLPPFVGRYTSSGEPIREGGEKYHCLSPDFRTGAPSRLHSRHCGRGYVQRWRRAPVCIPAPGPRRVWSCFSDVNVDGCFMFVSQACLPARTVFHKRELS